MIAAVIKEKQTVRYFTSVFVETIHGTRMVFNVAFPFQWRIHLAQKIRNQVSVGVVYGNVHKPWVQNTLGVTLQYQWIPNFSQDKPVESLQYEVNN